MLHKHKFEVWWAVCLQIFLNSWKIYDMFKVTNFSLHFWKYLCMHADLRHDSPSQAEKTLLIWYVGLDVFFLMEIFWKSSARKNDGMWWLKKKYLNCKNIMFWPKTLPLLFFVIRNMYVYNT